MGDAKTAPPAESAKLANELLKSVREGFEFKQP